MTTYDQGLVPSVCLSENTVDLHDHTNGTTNGASGIRLRSSSKSTSVLESETGSKPKPPMMRSSSDFGSEVKVDLGSYSSINQDDYDNSKFYSIAYIATSYVLI